MIICVKKARRLLRKLRRIIKRQKTPVAVAMQMGIVAGVGLILLTSLHTDPMKSIPYAHLLNTIAKGESNGNYNAYYGNSANTTIQFTSMTVQQVLDWQTDFAKQGSPSTAVGKYQIVQPTLNGLVQRLKLDKNTLFDSATQDRLAIALLERRGSREYAQGKISREQFAHNLSKEWAALPKVLGTNSHESYYAGDGLNIVSVSIQEITNSIDTLRK